MTKSELAKMMGFDSVHARVESWEIALVLEDKYETLTSTYKFGITVDVHGSELIDNIYELEDRLKTSEDIVCREVQDYMFELAAEAYFKRINDVVANLNFR